ncbi:MAG: hypothetical protein JXQ73_12735 [Phycisphaerae bacterium]|nr:hypothetical protein [Phycisphaerae bacterium]
MCITRLAAVLVVSTGLGFNAARAATIRAPINVPPIAVEPGDQGTALLAGSDCQRLGQPGEPDLPWKVVTILLPPDVLLRTVSASLEGARYEAMQGIAKIRPAPPEATWEQGRVVTAWPPDKTIVDGCDRQIYDRDALWPEDDVRLVSTGRLRKWRLATVAVPLVRYNPVAGLVQRLTAGAVVVTFARDEEALLADDASAALADSVGEDTVRRIAVNFPLQQDAYQAAAPEPDREAPEAPQDEPKPGYVIITTSALQAALTKLPDFVTHKVALGYDVQVVTEADFGGGAGNTAAENIRAWLQTHYVGDNIEYVLLIGNPHPTTGPVPMKMLWPRHNFSDYKEAPSDYYYADLTGNWDLDGDGYCGEWSDDFGSGGVDRHWEVIVGRIPDYGSTVAIDGVLQKTIDYDRACGDAVAWRKNVLLPMEPSDDSTPGYHLGERIKDDTVVPAGWTYHRVYEETYGLTPPPETTPCTKANVVAAWNSAPFGLVVWWTHGSSTSATDIMDVYNAALMDDTYPVFTFQVSCGNSYPESTNLSAVLLAHAAVATVGATRVSWYYVGQTYFANSPSNAGMGYGYAAKVVTSGLSCGYALHEIKQTVSPASSGTWMNYTVFNIYGDPSLHLDPEFNTMDLDITNDILGSVDLDPPPGNPNEPVFRAGSTVTLSAIPDDNGRFDTWVLYDPNYPGDSNHAVIDANQTITVTMDADRQIAAVFKCGPIGSLTPPLAMGMMIVVAALRFRRP